MRDVAVIGIGMKKWGELWDKSFRDLYVEAALAAIDDSGLDHVDSLVAGCMSSGLFVGQEHAGSMLADYLGSGPIPATRVESACASGGLAFRTGWMQVALGLHDVVLVGGVEKMTDVDGGGATYALATAADQEYECYQGATFPGLYAMMARAHMDRYGTTREQLSHVAVKNHLHGYPNENAQFRMKLTVDQVAKSTMVADPLTLLDCSPITDGAAAVILCPAEMAKEKARHAQVVVKGTGHATDTIALHQREDITYLASTEKASKDALNMAGLTINDMDFIELHDCFTIAEICVLEALGIVDKGKGGECAESGMSQIGGKMPVNVSGGLKSKGHPVGATGVAQIVEITEQLRGASGERQVENARRGLAQNMGGTGASCLVHVLEVQ